MIQIKLIATNSILLNLYITFLKKHLNDISLVKLPTFKRRISLLKSTHVNKKAQEQFEKRIFKALITFKGCMNIIRFRTLLINKPTRVDFSLNKISYTELKNIVQKEGLNSREEYKRK